MSRLPRRAAVAVFGVFAFAYFFSALVRAVTATLSPVLTDAFALQARDLGLLAGGYFLGFSLTQLPLGRWLDRHGPKTVILAFLAVAVAGCLAFSAAASFSGLLAARVLCGVGVSACLMAPLTGYRRWFDANAQLRANSWMLMTGSFGMLASTLPVQWLLPPIGWRPLFWGLAGLILLAMGLIAWVVPRWEMAASATTPADSPGVAGGYREVMRHPYFRRMTPVGFFCYGGMVAIQTLWAGPWMVKVAGYSPLQAAAGLFWINLAMLGTFWAWGLVTPALARRGFTAERLIARGLPLSFAVALLLIVVGADLSAQTTTVFALYCMACSVVSLAQPAVGMAFPPALAGRALSAYNLVIFAGVFLVQWGIGLAVDLFKAMGLAEAAAFQAAWAVFLTCCLAAYAHFMLTTAHNRRP
jgi:MFS family permease